MKYIITLLSFAFVFAASAQFDDIKQEKDSCYFRYKTVRDENGKMKKVRIKTKNELRYLEWECGKKPGWYDCNSDLTYNEETNTVYRINNDRSNFAGTNKPFTGNCESCHQNGRIQRRVRFVDGKEDGKDTTYYESGCPQIIRELVQGVDHGTWYYMYDSTEMLAWEMNYYLGEKHGKHIFFKPREKENPNDRDRLDTTKWENYDMGYLHGLKRTYHDNGVLKMEVNYDHGWYDGTFRLFNDERVIIQEIEYEDGEKHGEAKHYYDDGTLLRTEMWDKGLKNGEFKTFYYDQQLQSIESYKKGRKHGWFEEYHPKGELKSRKNYWEGVLVQEYRYDEHGREVYAFPKQETGPEYEDDAMPSEKKEADREKFLKEHRKKTVKEAKAEVKRQKKIEKAKRKEEQKKRKERAKQEAKLRKLRKKRKWREAQELEEQMEKQWGSGDPQSEEVEED
ncbi:MAG: toxin-antitoxin system YwqK family antitoxin [Fluviicola sp.]